MHTLAKDNIKLDRKTLSDLAINEPHSFKALVDRVKFMRGPNGICLLYTSDAADE